jgi:glutaredoxin
MTFDLVRQNIVKTCHQLKTWLSNILYPNMENITDGVFFFSKPNCPYCINLERDLVESDTAFKKYIPVSVEEANMIKVKSGRQTFPILYINKNLVGGYIEYRTLTLTNQIACDF